jgi:hypothetical protein
VDGTLNANSEEALNGSETGDQIEELNEEITCHTQRADIIRGKSRAAHITPHHKGRSYVPAGRGWRLRARGWRSAPDSTQRTAQPHSTQARQTRLRA